MTSGRIGTGSGGGGGGGANGVIFLTQEISNGWVGNRISAGCGATTVGGVAKEGGGLSGLFSGATVDDAGGVKFRSQDTTCCLGGLGICW